MLLHESLGRERRPTIWGFEEQVKLEGFAEGKGNQQIKVLILSYLPVSDSDGEESAGNAGEPSSIPGLGRPPGEGNGNPLQYSCLENSMGRGAWQARVYGVANGRTKLIN